MHSTILYIVAILKSVTRSEYPFEYRDVPLQGAVHMLCVRTQAHINATCVDT